MRKTTTNWSRFSKGLLRWQRGWSTCLIREEFGLFSLENGGFELPSTYEKAIDVVRLFTVVHGRKMQDNRPNLEEVRSRLHARKNFSLWGQTDIGRCCLGRLCSPPVEVFRT